MQTKQHIGNKPDEEKLKFEKDLSDLKSFDDVILLLGGSWGRFQKVTTLMLIILFGVGAQFFYSIPFYSYYPQLICFDYEGNAIEDCTPKQACNRELTVGYEIDWESPNTLKNWMTEHDWVCEEPFKIGFLGLISFFSYSIGSLFLTNQIDTHGRKYTLVFSSLITPFGILAIICFAKDIYFIYGIIFLIGLTYNPRSSSAYMFGIEFLTKSEQMKFGQLSFAFIGCFQALSAVWFYIFKDQNSYFTLLAVLMLLAIVWVVAFVPESPRYLLEKQKYEALNQSLRCMAKMNGIPSYQFKVDSIVEKLTDLRAQEDLIHGLEQIQESALSATTQEEPNSTKKSDWNRTTKTNLFASCYLWAMSGFSTYLIIYFSKYFEGNFFLIYGLQGLADSISLSYVSFILKRCESKTPLVSTLRLLVSLMICFTAITVCVQESGYVSKNNLLMPIMILLVRLQVTSIHNFGYHINQQLFPILIRGRAMGITNFVARPITGIATVVTEYTKQPLIYIIVFGSSSIFAVNLITEVDGEQDSQN